MISALLGAQTDELPAAVGLTDGMFITEDGPDWLEVKQGYATFLGAQSFLHPVGDGLFDSRAFYSPMRLRQDGDDIVGDVGPLDERRALFERAEGPRRQRVSLSFSADGRSVLLATQRSRVLRFERC